MKEITVTFRIDPEQEAAIKKISGDSGHSVEAIFDTMMLAGSKHDIDNKIRLWTIMSENTKRKETEVSDEHAKSCTEVQR